MKFEILIALALCNLCLGQGVFYPEHFETDKRKANLQGRLPLYAPGRCGPNQLLYPGDQQNDWICDCQPGAVYDPESDGCYPAFRRGPCKVGEMLVLGVDKVVPECIANECRVDGQVKIHNVCYQIGGSPPCVNPELSYVLGVDPATLKLDCVKLSISYETRFGVSPNASLQNQVDLAKVHQCARGTRRNSQGKCPPPGDSATTAPPPRAQKV